MQPVRSEQGLLKRAFLNQYNLILLGGAVAAVAELAWLGLGASSERFRDWVARQDWREAQATSAAARMQVAATLEPSYRARLKVLEDLAAEVRRMVVERGLDPAPLDREGRGLDAMLLVFVKIAGLHQQLGRFAGPGGIGHVEEDLMRLAQQLADEKDPGVRLTLKQALGLGQRRLKQHEQIDSQRRALAVKLSTLEMSFDYLRSHVFGGSTAEELALALDELAAGASFLPAAEAEVHASIARLHSPVTRTVTGTALAAGPTPGPASLSRG